MRRSRLGLLVAVASLAGAGCSSQANPDLTGSYHPPPGLKNPQNCGGVRTGGEPSGKHGIDVGGTPADCQANGAMCSLEGVDAFASMCPSGSPYAFCEGSSWAAYCTILDAGSLDASDAGVAADAAGD